MKKWKVGIVGLSRGGSYVNVFSAHPEVKVTALCDVDQDALSRTGRAFQLCGPHLFTEFDEFLNAPTDIVVIATPIALHAEQTIRSLEAGKHVLCEQTAAYTVEDCGRVVQAVKRAGKVYMMAENYAYFHYVREWKRMISEGKLGEIFYAEGEYLHEITSLLIDPKTGQQRWRAERPAIWYCAHCLGPLLMLMDDRVVKATGIHAGFHRFPEHRDLIGFLDMEIGLFQTRKGAVIKILRSQALARPHMIFYSLYGTHGFIETGRETPEGQVYVHGEQTAPQVIPCPTVDPNAPEGAAGGGHGTSEYYLIRDFLKAVETNTRPPIDMIRSMDMTIPGLVAHEAVMKGGVWLDVPQFDW